MTVTHVPGGYTVEHLFPGFRVLRGSRVVIAESVAGWREAVAVILVDREHRRAVRR